MTRGIKLLFAVLALAVLAAACGSAAANEPTTTPPTTAAPATTVAPTTTVTAAPPTTTAPAVDECMDYMLASGALIDRLGDISDDVGVALDAQDVPGLELQSAEMVAIAAEFRALTPPASHSESYRLALGAFEDYSQGVITMVVAVKMMSADLMNVSTGYMEDATAGFQDATAALPEGC